MVPETCPDWVAKVLHRHGTLLQGVTPLADAICIEVRGTTLVLAQPGVSRPPVQNEGTCRFQLMDGSGIFHISGRLTGTDLISDNSTSHQAILFEADGDSAVHFNRRSFFRVGVTLKGEVAIFQHDELGRVANPADTKRAILETQSRHNRLVRARRRPCILLDIGLGGTRIAMPPPAPRSGQVALLDIALGPGDLLRNVIGHVIQGDGTKGVGEFSAHTRLRFDALPARAESRLAKVINKIQVETLRQGVRDRG